MTTIISIVILTSSLLMGFFKEITLDQSNTNGDLRKVSGSSSEKVIRGLIGETMVSMPEKYIVFIEYDDANLLPYCQAHCDKKYNYLKIRSFGVDLKYPTMDLVDKYSESSVNRDLSVKMIHVGVLANSYSGDIKSMELFIDRVVNQGGAGIKYRKSGSLYGLESYSPIYEVKPGGGNIKGSMFDKKVYVRRLSGFSDTYIECLNSDRKSAPCTLQFMMPNPMRSIIKISFDSTLLSNWKNMQIEAQKTLMRFKR